MTGQYLFMTGMLLSFGVIITLGFLGFNIVFVRRLWAKMEEFTLLCVQYKKLIEDAEENKKKTAKVYEEAQAEKKYDVVNGEIKLVPKPKSIEEVG